MLLCRSPPWPWLALAELASVAYHVGHGSQPSVTLGQVTLGTKGFAQYF
jgi:hypothetical protein